MSLMGSIYVGSSGLQAHNNALNTAAHNLSNIETKGYTRQQILFGNKFYNNIGEASVSSMQVGIGVDYTKCRQVRDEFLDARFRKESGRGAFYDICYESTNEIETLLGEMEGASFADSLKNLWEAVQEVQKTPASVVAQTLFVSTCSQFLERAVAVSNGINAYQDNLNSRISGMVDDVNTIIDRVDVLNNSIRKAEIGLEEANDMRDERNYLIDKLSKMVNTKAVENANGGIDLYVENTPVLLGEHVNHLEVHANEHGFYNVTFGPLYDHADVYDFSRPVCADYDTDIGELKALLIARGDHRANYTDLEKVDPNDPTNTDYANEYYNHGRPNTATEQYNDIPVGISVVMNVQAEFDKLIHNITTAINNFLTDNSLTEKGAYGIEMFVRLGTDRYDAAGNYVVEDTSGSPRDVSTMYTVSNLKINPKLLKEPTINSFLTDDKNEDRDKADRFAEIFTGTAKILDMNKYSQYSNDPTITNPYEKALINSKWTLNPNVNSTYAYRDFYSQLCGQLANAGGVYKSIGESQAAEVSSIENARQMVVGVSSDDELQSIIKFQNAYNASSRYINVINDMLEQVLSLR